MAKSIADTGQLAFNGWSEPTVGIQAYWGALVIRIFGWSYESLRISTYAWSIGIALLMYATGRLIQLSRYSACFAALVLCLSPLALPLESSFMTEVPSTFFVLLATYAAARSGLDQSRAKAVAWLAIALVAVSLGTSIRQSNLVLLPVVIFAPAFFRRERVFGWWTAILGSVTAIGIAWMVHWFSSQPHAYSLPLLSSLMETFRNPSYTAFRIFLLLATMVLFCLPAFAASFNGFRAVDIRFAAAALACALAFFLTTHFWLHTLTLVPYGSIVTDRGVLTDDAVMGGRPRVIPGKLLILITLLAVVAVVFALRTAVLFLRNSRMHEPFRAWAILQMLFFLLYFGGVIARTSAMQPFDRYLLPVLPFFILGSLYVAQVPSPSWFQHAVLGLFAAFGIAAVHDYYAQRKICAAVADALLQSGVKRTEITSGFDYDSATEIETAGLVMVDCLHDPGPLKKFNRFLTCAPSIHARYAVGFSPIPGASELPIPPHNVRLWLPPFRANAKVFVLPASVYP